MIILKVINKLRKTPGTAEGAEVLGIHTEGPFINSCKKGAHVSKYIHSLGSVSIMFTFSDIVFHQ